MTRPLQRGFSIIELAVALTIAGIMLAIGAPAFSGYLQNARLGTTAKSFYSGLQTARAEAVKLNQDVEFVLTNSALGSTAVDAVSLDVNGRNWVVRQRPPASTAAYSLVEHKTGGSEAGAVAVAATTARITFNSLGASTAGGQTVIALSNPALGQCAPAGAVRCWNVVVTPGGQVRLCSPDATLAASDSRAC